MFHVLSKCSILSLLTISLVSPVFADDGFCSVTMAVSYPPLKENQQVAFNVNSQLTNNSVIADYFNPMRTINHLMCSKEPYLISATVYSVPTNGSLKQAMPIGQCVLRSGPVVLSQPGNSISVVFPNDFTCNVAIPSS